MDLTAQNVYTLSPQSKAVLAKLDQPVDLHAFVEGGVDPELDDLLDSYKYASDKVTFRMIDPDKEPELAERFKVTKASNTVRIQYGEPTATVTQTERGDDHQRDHQGDAHRPRRWCASRGPRRARLDEREARGFSS